MANANQALKRLQGLLTDAPKGTVKKGRIQALLDEVETQNKALDKMEKAKTFEEQKEAIVPQSSWIKVLEYNKFAIKIGRAGYPFPGSDLKHFAVKSVDEARDVIGDIVDAVKNSEEMQKTILEYEAPKKK